VKRALEEDVYRFGKTRGKQRKEEILIDGKLKKIDRTEAKEKSKRSR